MQGTSKWIAVLLVIGVLLVASTWLVQGDFGGTDALVEEVAGSHGAEARAPLLNTEGYLNWIFGVGGLLAGFAIGYYVRELAATGPEGQGDLS